MKLLIDDANIAKIKNIYQYYPIDGVTTNPSILAKSGREPYEILKEIRAFIGNDAELHAQVLSRDAEGMIEEAHKMAEILGKNTYIKVPTIPEGLKAMKALAGPFPQIKFIPTGGIDATNLDEYLAWEKIAAVGGSFYVKEALAKMEK